MEPNGAESEVFSQEGQAVLNEGVGLILSRWTAMRAAVENGWGGRDSQRKAERTVSKVFDFFTLSKDPLDFDGLADILEEGLLELNTVADDGSLEEVVEKLLDLYEECVVGNYQTVEKLKGASSQAPRASVLKVSNGEDDSDDEEEDDEQSTDMMVVDEARHHSAPTPVMEPSSRSTPAEAGDDGWTVVPGKRNKGKRI